MTKNGMRGFSAGILISCAVFSFFYYMMFDHPGEKSVEAHRPLTEAAVNEYLDSHNRVALDTSDYQKYQKWQEDSAAKAAADGKKTDSTAEKKESSSKPEKKKATTYEINIRSGMTPGDISSELVSAKVLKSDQKQDFDQYLHQNDLEKYVQLGTFKVSSEMTIQQIARVITKNK
ncbi:hypothetical protein EWH99_11290 [Sporolactobacillus sp. THM7-7]|nr:hypothetical protein EWH99_11290 [Sporolactobacillus sp. THM7-7]